MDINEFLIHFQDVSPIKPRSWMATCPAHGDHRPSLSIRLATDRILIHCHAGCKPHDIVAAAGLAMRDLFLDSDPRHSLRSPLVKVLTGDEVLAGSDDHYDYVGEDSSLLYRMVRLIGKNGLKTFVGYRPIGDGGWAPGLDGVRRVLYRLPELLASSPSELVFIVEGEKDVDRLAEAGLVATTNPFGAGKWRAEFNTHFRGRKVTIIPDNDESGLKHARQVADSLLGVGVSVKVVDLPDVPKKGDVSDYLDAGHTREELLDLVAVSPVARRSAGPEEAPAHATDLGNAMRLVKLHGADLRYCHLWGKWLCWDGRRWAIDETGDVMRRAKDTVRLVYEEASRQDDSRTRSAIAEHARRSESENRLRAMIALAQSEPGIPLRPQDLDADPWKFNVLNGTLDLRTGELLPQSRSDLLTKAAPVAYDHDAQCPRWDAFLQRIFGGDAELISFVQRAVGYALTGATREQVLFILYGTGANGKTTLIETVHNVFGVYAKRAEFETFLARPRGGPRNDIADLAGARFVSAQELENGARLAESIVKLITGGDSVKARFLYSEHFEFRPQFKLFLSANHRPTIRGTDHAIWRRIRLVPFAVTIPEEEQDKDLIGKLKEELPGILAWAVRGCLEWQQDGLGSPTAVTTATGEYRAESDILGAFLSECCVQGSSYTASASDLYGKYKEWAERNGEQVVSQTTFGKQLRERGFERRKRGGLIFRDGLGIAAGDGGDGQDGFPEKSHVRDNEGELARKPSNHPPTIPSGDANVSPARGQSGDGGEGSESDECPS